jgi:LysR family transcriptional regulator, glycine cleavage system transcriptional activator
MPVPTWRRWWIKARELSLPGLGYYLLHLPEHPRKHLIMLFADWLRSVS